MAAEHAGQTMCPYCGAKPNQPCRSVKSGRVLSDHNQHTQRCYPANLKRKIAAKMRSKWPDPNATHIDARPEPAALSTTALEDCIALAWDRCICTSYAFQTCGQCDKARAAAKELDALRKAAGIA